MVPVTRTGNATKDMSAIMERVRRMSDSQLADILAGKDVSVPQFAAMTEAMGRKQLRQAVDGAQAQQQAQQPSIKEQLLAEQQAPAGLDQLPAPNMESMDMAGGGIIAFENGGGVMDRIRDFFYAQGEFAPERNRMSGSYKGDEPLQGEGITGLYKKRQEEKRAKKADIDEQIRLNKLQPEGFGEPIVTSGEDPYGTANARSVDELKGPGVSEPPVTAAAPAAVAPKSAIDIGAATKFERRASPFGQMSAEKVDFEGLKDKGLGEGLMKMGAGLLSAPGSKGFAAGIQALADSGAVSRKEINALKKDARDYDFNIKKADAAFEQGNDELGLKYTEAANLNKYRMAALNKPGEGLQLLNALGDPKLMARYIEMNAAKKPTGVVSRTDALKEWNDLAPNDKRRMKDLGVTDFNSYYSYLSTGLPGGVISDTLPKDAKVRS